MCYSAQITAAYQKLVRMTGATLSLQEFAVLYAHDPGKKRPKTPKAMDDAFRAGSSPEELAVWAEVEQWNRAEAAVLEQELFANRKRLAEAERALQVKETKKAREDVRIAGNKIDRALAKLADLKRTEPKGRDSRIFPGVYAPVIVSEGGKLVIRPMRYQCRLAGKPANYDQRYPGTYNARRDSLEKFWAPAFGHTHGLLVVDTFYENVEGPDGKNQVVQFTPRTGEPMLVACLWSHWTDPTGKDPDLLSFAAITDDPEPEVAAAGHDRTIINIKPEHVDAWLNPDPADLAALYRIFDDKRHPFYEHRLAA
ncbi:TPA: SOS response-associated peptidase family protein [Stenotrophomonas maltophilia]|nr:SOS response-associated peptidase family protein [Stenotrophomonas maltophilia]HDS1158250.1 SOS response-associated peptidase family protein [Stenotrophomonas maltophilia]HDS1167715.1 SOS response-associated peptidase family protein [Stenotrophomonas maltophilia]HDS1171316.1 SOS response-associated peptidase family protein [Stenotrophomonas maltophilia]HDS1177370.1 SOS response-associated peptidase family protein [Stenotrophomonas maltophilia]